jgi:4'-phosphopantetheinyl transferase
LIQLEKCLSRDERARGDHLVCNIDRQRYVVGRGILRILLSGYTNLRPEAIQFQYGPQGKPSLAIPSDVSFNIAHSAGTALFGFVGNRAIGIDVELERQDLEFDEIAARFFSEAEQAALKSVPTEQRLRAFFTCWTRKEAYIKALGGGLTVPLERFDMTVAPGQPAELIADRGDSKGGTNWTVYDIRPDDGYAAAAVVEGHGGSLQLWDLVHLAQIDAF